MGGEGGGAGREGAAAPMAGDGISMERKNYSPIEDFVSLQFEALKKTTTEVISQGGKQRNTEVSTKIPGNSRFFIPG